MSDINVEIFTTRTRRTNSSPSLPSESLATEPAVQPSVPSVSTFIGLSDTPSTYSGQANKITAVNSGETGLQFISVGDITNGFVPYTGANQNVNLGTNTITANSFITNSGTSLQFVKGDGSLDSNTYALASALGNYQLLSEKGTANGYASLDSNGKVPLTQINDALLGNVNFQGLWNANTNTPTLVNPPSSATKGHYYIVSTAGTFASIDFEVGDWIISNGSTWNKVDNTDAVSSVFGRTGNVTAQESDYQDFYPRLSQSYNNPSWINSLAWSKITGTPTTLLDYGITDAVPSNRTLTINGTSFDLSANRSWTIPTHDAVTLGTANGLSLSGQVLSLGLASGSTTGALSSTDWNTFNNKQNALTNPVTGTGANGRVAFWTGTNTQSSDAGLFWDNTNKILSLLSTNEGLFDQNANLGASTNANIYSFSIRNNSTSTSEAGLLIQHTASSNTAQWGISVNRTGSTIGDLIFRTRTGGSTSAERWRILSSGILQSNGAQTIQTSTGNLTLATAGGNGNILLSPNGTGAVFINTTTALTGGGRLQVNGQLNIATVNNATGDFLTHVNGIINKRTPSEVRTDIGAGTSNLVLGDTSTTAYRGDRGTVAYDYSQVGHLPLAGGTMTGMLTVPSLRGTSTNLSVRISTLSGFTDIGAMNTSYSHFQTDRPTFYFNKPNYLRNEYMVRRYRRQN